MSGLAFVCCAVSQGLSGAALSGTIKDSSGGVVAAAVISAQTKSLNSPLQGTSDDQGHFRLDTPVSGAYRITVARDGFEPWARTVTVADKPVELNVTLKLKVLTTSVQVSARRSALANSDPNYLALRGGKLTKVYRVDNLVIKRDVGTLQFRSGSFSFLPPVMGQVTTGVFVGDGNFQMKTAFDMAARHLRRISGSDTVDEDFTAMVVYFSDSTFEEVKQHSELADESPEQHEAAFRRVKSVIESRRQPSIVRGANPLTMLERLLNYEDIPNYDAEILAELYNPAHRGSFRAFLHGRKHSDLRFITNPNGAMPMLGAPEETALLNFDPSSESDGVWYLSHSAAEIQAGKASSVEEKRLIAAQHYQMQVLVGKPNLLGNLPDLTVTCDLRFRALDNGTRMVKFDLVPDLQMTRVAWNGKEIPFIQESRKRDGSFYLEMPEALVKDRAYQVTFEYSGGEVLQSQFGTPPPRRVWYPTPSGQPSHATYDITFRAPHGETVVSVGKLVKQTRDGGFDLSQWVSDVPLTQAVFVQLDDTSNKTIIDEPTQLKLTAYINFTGGRGFIAGSSNDILADFTNSVRVFDNWFGHPAYDGLSVVVSRSNDSLPGLVYASPVMVAGYSSLVSQSMSRSRGRFGGPPPTVRTFLDEAFPREIAKQWWGNTITPATFHDAWLASGFANFSTSLYDLAAYLKPDTFRDHWAKAREALLVNNRWGEKLNNVGPIWMGLLNDTYKTPRAGAILAEQKGGYVLEMLRSLMWEPATGDRDFRVMMQDYVKECANQPVSTEYFKYVLEKHMKPQMDPDRNGRMDWFFADWVYGTDVPSYKLEYTLAPEKGGKLLLTGKLTQSGVSSGFVMPVPVFAEFGSRTVRIGAMLMRGNTSGDFKIVLPEQPKKILLNVNNDILTDKQEVKQLK